MQLEQAFEEFATAFDREGTGALVAVHAAVVATTVGWVSELKEGLAELEQFFHALVTGSEQALAGFVAVNDGAGPAAKTGIAATGGAGVNLDGALTVGGVGIELVQRAVVAAPWIAVLKQVSPYFFSGEEFDWVRNPYAREIRVTAQAFAGLAPGHRLGAGRTFGPTRSQVKNRFAPVAEPLIDEHIDGIDLHPLRTPAESAIGRRIAATDDVYPERLLWRRLEQVDFNVEPILLGKFLHPRQRAFDHFDDCGDFYASIRAEDYNRLLPLVFRSGQNRVEHERRQHCTVLPAAETNQPGAGILQVQLAESVPNILVNRGGHGR